MTFTTLRLCNSGIWKEGWYSYVNEDGHIVPDRELVEYDNVWRLSVDIGNSITLNNNELSILDGIDEHPESRSRYFQLLCDGINRNRLKKLKLQG